MTEDSPFKIFKSWVEEAKESEDSYPEAFTLATVSNDGQPSARTLLLRGITDTHYTFFTNYNSKKGLELQENSKATMLFYWKSTKKQIRVEGICTKSSKEVSDDYWNQRAYESRLHAFVSKQSQNIDIEPAEVNSLFKEVRTKHPLEIPRPENWGGFDLKPTYFEFWEEGDYRWHKRNSFTLKENVWVSSRLYP